MHPPHELAMVASVPVMVWESRGSPLSVITVILQTMSQRLAVRCSPQFPSYIRPAAAHFWLGF